MSRIAHNLSWTDLVDLKDEQIPLLRAALMIAEDEYPTLDSLRYECEMDVLEARIRREVGPEAEQRDRLSAINRELFSEYGLRGNADDYYDPRNSYVNEVFDRKLGIPISLGLIQMELGRRLGVPLEGVSFPGHFLVRLPVEGGLLVLDPYHGGRSIDADELRQRARPHLGDRDVDDADLLRLLAPASHRHILLRMLRNLKALYTQKEDWPKALRCSDRMLSLDPSVSEEVRDRGLLYLRVGHLDAARTDLSRYLEQQQDAEDVDSVREALIEASRRSPSIN